jgi:hypothetical protein
MTAVIVEPEAGRSLISPALFERLANRISTDEQVDRARADRIMDQALAFLGTCATSAEPLTPSDAVDVGWHTFVLYTREYAQFCDRIAGRFIHHVPTDDTSESTVEQPARGAQTGTRLARTVAAIRHAGFTVDGELWRAAGECNEQRCSQCHAGCHDSP